MTQEERLQFEQAVVMTRGTIISAFCDLEFALDMFIAKYFAIEERQADLISLIITPRMTFNDKRSVFKVIIDNFYKDFKEANPRYNKDLENMMTHRNALAHFPVAKNDESFIEFKEKKVIKFGRIKHGIEYGYYNNDFNNRILDSIYDYTDKIRNLPIR